MAFNKEESGESSSFNSIAKQLPVKISEHYRPPRKVTVSSGVLQRKHVEDFSLLYDFSLEKSIVDKMGQMKLLRAQDKQKQKKSQAAYNEAKELELFNQGTQLQRHENALPEEHESPKDDNKKKTQDPNELNEQLTTIANEQLNNFSNEQFTNVADEELASVENPPPSNPSLAPVISNTSPMFPSPQPTSDPMGPHLINPPGSSVQSPNPPPNPSVPPAIMPSRSSMSPPTYPAGPHFINPRDSPVLSPVPFGQHSPNKSATRTPVTSPVSFSTNDVVQPINSVTNLSTDDFLNVYQTQNPANITQQKHNAQTYPSVSNSVSYPANAQLANRAPYVSESNPMCAPMPDNYTYSSTPSSVFNHQNISEWSSASNEYHLSSVPATPPAPPIGNYYSSAPQSSYVSTIASLASPVVHSGLVPGNSPQVNAPQYTNVLQPTHLLSDALGMAVIKEKQKVNVKDFEQDTSSPFDSCELKSINDMEELRHVLEHCVMKQEQLQHQQLLQQYQQQVQQQSQQQVQQYQHQIEQSQQQAQQYQQQFQHQIQQSLQHQQKQDQLRPYNVRYGPQFTQGYESLDLSRLYQPPNNTNKDHHAMYNPKLTSQCVSTNQSVFDGQTFPPHNEHFQTTSVTFTPQNQHSQPAGHTFPPQNQHSQTTGQTCAPQNQHTQPTGHSFPPQNQHSQTTGQTYTPQNQHSQFAGHSFPPQNHHSQTTGQISTPQNQHSQPQVQPFHPYNPSSSSQAAGPLSNTTQPLTHTELHPSNQVSNSLPSNPSYYELASHIQNPQLSHQNPNFDQNTQPPNYNPNFDQNTQPANHNPNFDQNAPLPFTSYSSEHMPHQHNSSSGQRVPSVLNDLRNELIKRRQSEATSPFPTDESALGTRHCDIPQLPVQVSYLPNPYLSLSSEDQKKVDWIVEMGFLQSRSARALQALGSNQDKVVEFLIQVLALEEKFPALAGTDLCEEALSHHRGDVTATESHLAAVTKLTRLGFPAARVARVLLSVDGNEEKALDALVM